MGKWTVGLVLVMSSCGVDTGAEGSSLHSGQSSQGRQRQELKSSLFPAPSVPATPSVYRSGMLLYPKTVSSAYTITYGSKTNPREFYAWGFDVVNRECVFYLRGNLTDLAKFEQEVKAALQVVPQNNPTYVGSGGQGQIGTPRDPGPSGDDPWLEAHSGFYAL